MCREITVQLSASVVASGLPIPSDPLMRVGSRVVMLSCRFMTCNGRHHDSIANESPRFSSG
jgi:hypothetical protein